MAKEQAVEAPKKKEEAVLEQDEVEQHGNWEVFVLDHANEEERRRKGPFDPDQKMEWRVLQEKKQLDDFV